MGSPGFATVTLVDNGGAAIVVPSTQIQVVMGVASSGAVGTITATKSPSTLSSTFGWGPLPEAAALTCLAGGTVLAIPLTAATAGALSAVTTSQGTGGSTGTSVTTVSGTPYDTYFVEVLYTTGGTIGTGPIAFTISLDAGRSYSPIIQITTATTYLIPGTNITLNFAAGTKVAGNFDQFCSTEPLWNDAGVLVALNALKASPYGQQGFGSMHIVGGSTSPGFGTSGAAGSDVTTIAGDSSGYITAWSTNTQPIYAESIFSARDAEAPTAWGGSGGETDAQWQTSILTGFSAVAARRASVCAAYYNMPSALINPLGMVPRFRRSIAYSVAQRTVLMSGPQRSWGRVKDGPLGNIVINPLSDPTDGFNYHNEAINPGLNAGRFVTTTTRAYLQGVYVLQANNFASTGSQINSRPLMAVWNVAATILVQVGQDLINDNVRLLPAGTLDPRDAATIQSNLLSAINANMTAQQMISSATVIVDQTANVGLNGIVPITATLTARGIVLQVNINLQYSDSSQAGPGQLG
jgi:uncharacterized protein DUF2586